MDLEGAADQLYAISPDEFVERRKALVAEVRAAKDRPLAKQIGELRRPTRSAWLVNVVARAEPERVTELLDLGAALQQAQQRMAGDELRRLSKERRTLIDALSRRAAALGSEQGYAATDAAIQEVGQTFQAALGDPAVADLVRAGRVHQAVSYGGFGPGDLASALADSLPAAESKQPVAAPTPEEAAPPEGSLDTTRIRAAKQQVTDARQAAAALAEAESVAETATARADELADEVESLRTRLRDTETQERGAREEARTARKRATELRREAAAAAQSAKEAAERLDQLRNT